MRIEIGIFFLPIRYLILWVWVWIRVMGTQWHPNVKPYIPRETKYELTPACHRRPDDDLILPPVSPRTHITYPCCLCLFLLLLTRLPRKGWWDGWRAEEWGRGMVTGGRET